MSTRPLGDFNARLISLNGGRAERGGAIEHTCDVLMNELAGWTLPSQKFGANAVRLRMHVLRCNLLSAFKRVGLPEELLGSRPKRPLFLVLNTVCKIARHACETLLHCADAIARTLADAPRIAFPVVRSALVGE